LNAIIPSFLFLEEISSVFDPLTTIGFSQLWKFYHRRFGQDSDSEEKIMVALIQSVQG
jgi:hypothetical protein